jgi:putative flippase GtrA
MEHRLNGETGRWAFVAATTFILDAFSFYFLYLVFKYMFVTNAMSFVVSTLYNFLMHKHWTYRDADTSYLRLLRYLALLIVSLIINSLLICVFLSFNVSPLLSKISASIITVFLNYVGLRNFVFVKQR